MSQTGCLMISKLSRNCFRRVGFHLAEGQSLGGADSNGGQLGCCLEEASLLFLALGLPASHITPWTSTKVLHGLNTYTDFPSLPLTHIHIPPRNQQGRLSFSVSTTVVLAFDVASSTYCNRNHLLIVCQWDLCGKPHQNSQVYYLAFKLAKLISK